MKFSSTDKRSETVSLIRNKKVYFIGRNKFIIKKKSADLFSNKTLVAVSAVAVSAVAVSAVAVSAVAVSAVAVSAVSAVAVSAVAVSAVAVSAVSAVAVSAVAVIVAVDITTDRASTIRYLHESMSTASKHPSFPLHLYIHLL